MKISSLLLCVNFFFINAESTTFASPNYPDNYPNNHSEVKLSSNIHNCELWQRKCWTFTLPGHPMRVDVVMTLTKPEIYNNPELFAGVEVRKKWWKPNKSNFHKFWGWVWSIRWLWFWLCGGVIWELQWKVLWLICTWTLHKQHRHHCQVS